MFSSSLANSIPFLNLDGGLPNAMNTLHADYKKGGFKVIPYCQRFNKADVIKLQFESDSATAPSLKSYTPLLNEALAPVLTTSYGTDTLRYFYNFEVTLGSSYYDKKIQLIATQGAIELTSEPIFCEDLTEDLANGRILKFEYSGVNSFTSDLNGCFNDWANDYSMFFYVESVLRKPKNTNSNEVIEGAQSDTIVSSNTFFGNTFETGIIPPLFSLKIIVVSSLTYFAVNGIQFIQKGFSEEIAGSSTSVQLSLDLTAKNIVGLNVDDLGSESTQINDNMAFDNKRNTAVNGSGWAVANKLGYFVHIILIKHAATSAGDAIVICGTTPGGNDLIDEEMGNLPLSMYSSTSVPASFPLHSLKNQDVASNIYFSIYGAGEILDISIQFISLIPTI